MVAIDPRDLQDAQDRDAEASLNTIRNGARTDKVIE
jgi:hypothetical protein